MLSATEFIYDGISSNTFNLKIASLNSDVNEEKQYLTPNVSAVKSKKSKKFYFVDVSYDNLPTYSFSIFRDNQSPYGSPVITDKERREILGWLIGRKGFKELIIQQPDLMIYKYNCIFNDVKILYHAGDCIGFTLTATFDSPFCYCEKTTNIQTGDGTPMDVIVDNSDSDLWDEYTYPIIEFTPLEPVGNNKAIIIYNTTDDDTHQRPFEFNITTNDEMLNNKISVDNEKKIISGNGASLQKFNKKWIRLRRGYNTLNVQIKGTFEIKTINYMKMGF